ncbi:M14 family zinc carboxypeptidase [Natrononativus amylolyticus]|uniref:M14 family zinc carboxypeptidase n=1 Tax=Natrononativus amylolyticus TaxID=2963434 RepID=UPI0020CE95BE|nr:M14 family zinc carboxypeptidase [Natrononativus amylolyticus]
MSRNHHHHRAAQQDGTDHDSTEGAFDGAIDRRTFLSLAAATGVSLAAPSTVAAEETATHEAMTAEAEFVVAATEAAYEAPLVFEFTDDDSLGAFRDDFADPTWDIDEDDGPPPVVTRKEPTPAAHAHLTEAEVADAVTLDGIELIDFSPGANPFWTLEEPYADRIFPAVEDARNYVSHEENAQGLRHLEETYPDLLRVQTIGHGPGYENVFTGDDPDPRDVYVAEVTNDIQDEAAFREKEKVVFVIGIHGDERQGVEAGVRVIEEAAKGEADDFEHLLDDIVMVFVYINPDGWVVRKPHYESPDTLNFSRGNSTGLDTNRQYPELGWVNPAFWPADPDDAPSVRPDDDQGRGYADMVPDALATVEHLRGYENVTYLCDYHGMHVADYFVLNLETNAAFDHDGIHELDNVNARIRDGKLAHWGGIEAIQQDIDRIAVDRFGQDPDDGPFNQGGLLNWGTIYDCIGYTAGGGIIGWAGQPESKGGLGARAVSPEMCWANTSGFDKQWRPYIARHQSMAYRISMREYAEMTAADSHATVATGDQDTAYVASETLTRSSADLSHTDDPHPGNGQGPPDHARGTQIARRHDTVQPGPAGTSVAASESTSTLSVQLHAHDADEGVVTVRNPAGEVVSRVDLADIEEDACCMGRQGGVYIPAPTAGEWTIDVDGETAVDVDIVTLATDAEHEDPEAILGYTQREYEVNPMQFFDDLEPFLESGGIDGLRVHDVRIGRLLRGRSGQRHYDKLVVSHAEGLDDPRYISAIEEFVAAGGDLVLTDAGVAILGALEVGQAAAITDDDIEEIEMQFAALQEKAHEHPLLAGIRPIQQEVWKVSQLGYTTGVDQPATIVDEDAFEAAGGTIAGTFAGGSTWQPGSSGVGVGTLTAGDAEINVIGSVLPPANQSELHPFGMADYATSFMGHTLVCNALGFEQRRYVNGDLVDTWGEVR